MVNDRTVERITREKREEKNRIGKRDTNNKERIVSCFCKINKKKHMTSAAIFLTVSLAGISITIDSFNSDNSDYS